MCDAELLGSLFAQHGLTHVAHLAAQVEPPLPLTLALTLTLTLTLSLTLTLTHLAAQAGVRYSLSNPQSYMRNNLQCFITLLETHRRFPKVNPNHSPHP